MATRSPQGHRTATERCPCDEGWIFGGIDLFAISRFYFLFVLKCEGCTTWNSDIEMSISDYSVYTHWTNMCWGKTECYTQKMMRLNSNLAVSVRRPRGHRTVSVRPPYDFWKILRSPCGDRTVTVRSPHDHRRVGLKYFTHKNRTMSAANVIINIAARRPLRWVKKSQMKKSYGDRTMTVANVIQALAVFDILASSCKRKRKIEDNGVAGRSYEQTWKHH